MSVASAWETAIKMHLGKLTVDAPSAEAFFDEQMLANGFTYLPIAPAHVFRAAALPLPQVTPPPFSQPASTVTLNAALLRVCVESSKYFT